LLPKELVPHKENQFLRKPANEKTKEYHERSNVDKSKLPGLSRTTST